MTAHDDIAEGDREPLVAAGYMLWDGGMVWPAGIAQRGALSGAMRLATA